MDVEISDVWKRDEVDSPCIKLCVIHPAAKICMGCFRTIDEISGWSRLDNHSRQILKEALPSREILIKPRRKRRGHLQTNC